MWREEKEDWMEQKRESDNMVAQNVRQMREEGAKEEQGKKGTKKRMADEAELDAPQPSPLHHYPCREHLSLQHAPLPHQNPHKEPCPPPLTLSLPILC